MTWGVTIRGIILPKEKVVHGNIKALRGKDFYFFFTFLFSSLSLSLLFFLISLLLLGSY